VAMAAVTRTMSHLQAIRHPGKGRKIASESAGDHVESVPRWLACSGKVSTILPQHKAMMKRKARHALKVAGFLSGVNREGQDDTFTNSR
jgi:hypothetical protein